MTHYMVFFCENDHMIYAESQPKFCKECKSQIINMVYGVTVSKEEVDGSTTESEYGGY